MRSCPLAGQVQGVGRSLPLNPLTHFLAGWSLADATGDCPRDRLIITLAGVLPDLDGLGAAIDLWTAGTPAATTLYLRWHHVLGHNIFSGLAFAAIAFLCAAGRRGRTAVAAFAAFHLHLFCDLLGSGGPFGSNWPIFYFYPFSMKRFEWAGQWPLVSWQNTLITIVLMIWVMVLARKRGYSFLELIWPRGDREFVAALRRRFPLES